MALLFGAVIAGLVVGAFANSEPLLIQSKFDGKVLTVVDEYAPPTGGPYQRLGVRALPLNASRPQHWVLYDGDSTPVPFEGAFYSVDAPTDNSLAVGLPCPTCFSYPHHFTISRFTNTTQGYLLQRNVLEGWTRCVKNPGMEEFITDASCDENDDSQLWFLSDRD